VVFRTFLLVFLIISASVRAAELYLIKAEKTTRIVFTAEEKHPYKLKMERPGLISLTIFGAVTQPRIIQIKKDPVLKQIEIKKSGNNSVIYIQLDENYTLKAKEEYPPFKLILTPVKLTDIHTLEKMFEEAFKKQDCETVIDIFNRLPVEKYPPEKRIEFEKARFSCSLKLKDYENALKALNVILSLKKDEKLWAKKIEILFLLKRYDETVAEGTLFMKEFSDPLSDHIAAIVAEALIKLGKIENAIILLKNVLQKRPDTPYIGEICKALAKAYYVKKNYIAAFLLFEKAYEKDKKAVEKDPEALFMYGRCAAKLNQNKKALKILLKTFNLYPKSKEAPKCLALIGDIYRNQNEWELAYWFYKLCLTLFPDTEAAAVSKIHIAEYYEKKKDYKKALNIYTEAMVLYPKYKKVLEVAIFRRGLMLLKLKRYEEAINAFNEFIVKFPGSKYVKEAEKYIEEAEFGIGKREFAKKRWEEALKRLANFAIKYPENPHTPEAVKLAGEALVRICEDKFKRKDCFGILFFWENYKNFFPRNRDNALPLFHIAICLLKMNKTEEAIKELEWIHKNVGKNFKERKRLLEILARAYIKEENYKKAIPVLKELIESYPPAEIKEAYRILMKYYFSEGKYSQLKKLKEKLSNYKNVADLLNLYRFYAGLHFIEKKSLEKGIALLETFLSDKSSTVIYPLYYEYAKIFLARLYYNQKDLRHAFEHYLQFINIFPRSRYTPEALFMAGYIKRNERIGSYFWQRCLKEFPKSYWTKEIKALNLASKIKSEVEKEIKNE